MFRLATLGGLALGYTADADVTIPRRRLALLALLASAGDRGLSRDKLIGYLWPNSSTDDARHSLEQLLYAVRHQLDGTVFRGSDPVCLNGAVITSDVAAFEDAVERGADGEAVRIYAGDFLDGFYLNGAAEFERWVDDERMRLRTAYAGALERLAEHAARRNDWSVAVANWRRLVALDRLSTRSVLGLVRSMVAGGDHAEALRTATAFESLVREELGLPVDPALAAFLKDLRAGRANGFAASAAETRVTPSEPHHEPVGSPAQSGNAQPAGAPATVVGDRRKRVVAAVLVVAPAIAVASIWSATTWRGTPTPRVEVAVFENWTGDSTLDYVGTMAADYTTTALARTAMLDVIFPAFDVWDPRNARPRQRATSAARVRHKDATIVVTGAYTRTGDSLSFTGRGVDVKSGRMLFGFDSVSAKELADVIDQVRQRVMSGIATVVDPRLATWAGNQGKSPTKFAAFQEFANGMRAFVSGIVEQTESTRGTIGFTSSRAHLERAFRLDSTYYIAALWWFWARSNMGDRRGADSVLAILAPRSDAMTPYERTLYEYEVAYLHGTPERRYQLDQQLVAFAPTSEYRYCLARDAVQAGHPREALAALETLDDRYSWVRLMTPAPGFRIRALVQLGEFRSAVTAATRVHDVSPDDLTSSFPEVDALAALGRFDDVEAVVERSADRVGPVASSLPNLMLHAGLRLQAADRAEPAQRLFARALELYNVEPTSPSGRDPILFGRGRSLYYLGRWNDARATFEQLTRAALGTTPYDWRALLFLGSLAARRGDMAEVERIRGLLSSPAVNPAEAQYFEARVATVLGEDDRAVAFLAQAVTYGAQVWQVMEEGDAAPSMDPDFNHLRRSRSFRKAAGFW